MEPWYHESREVSAWPAATSGPLDRLLACASSPISSLQGADSERVEEEKNHFGQGHSRDTLLQIPPVEANSTSWSKFPLLWSSDAQERDAGQEVRWLLTEAKCGHSCAALVSPAKQWQRKPSSRSGRMIPDCMGKEDGRTRGRYFRSLAFEELSRVFC
jgi:hypothetical protein